jgi:streptogramin lyase
MNPHATSSLSQTSPSCSRVKSCKQLALAGALVATLLCGASAVSAQAVKFYGPFRSYNQNFVVYAQGIAVNAVGEIYITGIYNLGYVPVDANGIPQESQEVHIDSTGDSVQAMAIDSQNNIYRVDAGAQEVQKYTYVSNYYNFASNNKPTYIGTGWTKPGGVAVDAALNVYVLDAGPGTITKLTPNGSGGYTQAVLYTNQALLANTIGLSIDANGDFFIASGSNYGVSNYTNSTAAVYEVKNTSGTYSISTIGSGWNSPSSTAVDFAGNLWVTDFGSGEVYLMAPLANGGFNQISYIKIPELRALTVNKEGQLYGIAYTNSYAAIYAGGSAPRFIGSNPPGTPNPPTTTVKALFFENVTLGGVSVTTEGVPGQDFTEAAGTTCTPGVTYHPADSCTVVVNFSPTAIGQRFGAIVLTDNNGNVIGTNPMYGLGSGPLAKLAPGVIKLAAGTGNTTYNPTEEGGPPSGANLNGPTGGTIDDFGNGYIADTKNNRLMLAANGTIITFAGNGSAGYNSAQDGGLATAASLSGPQGATIDGAGNVYIADTGNNRIRKVAAGTGIITTYAGTGSTTYTPSQSGGLATAVNLNAPTAVTIDKLGNLYIADTGNNVIWSVDPTTGIITLFAGTGASGYSSSQEGKPANSATFTSPTSIAFDPTGDLFVADSGNNRVRVINASSGFITSIGSGILSNPSGVVTDPAGDVYIADTGNAVVRKYSAATQTLNIVGGIPGTTGYFAAEDGGPATSASFDAPYGLVFDPNGNLFVIDSSENRIREIKATTPTLSFPQTTVGSTSTALTATLENEGNASLTVSSLAPGTSNFILSGGTCTGSISLPSGGTCSVGVEFDPQSPGSPLMDYVSITDNASNSPQSISLSGNGIPVTPPTTQLLNIVAANITVTAGATPSQYVSQLMASYTAPGLTGVQLAAEFANAEVGFTVTGPGFSYNIPLYSYGTYYGANFLQAVPANAPLGTYTLTPYLIGPGAAGFSFTETPGTLTISAPVVLQPLSITAAKVAVVAGATPTQYVSQLMASYFAPGLTGTQLAVKFANAEVGFTVSAAGGSYNIPLYSYGTYYGANLLSAVPANAPQGTYTMTPYLTGPGASNFTFTPTAGTLTISAPGSQLLSITAANITVLAGVSPTQTVAQLMASYSAPGLTGLQLAAKFSNCEVGFTIAGPGFSYNIPLYSYGTYDGTNFLQEPPANAPLATYTLTPYLIGPGASAFAVNPTPGTLTVAAP